MDDDATVGRISLWGPGMRISADIQRCPHCNGALPARDDQRPSGLIVWIILSWVVAALIVWAIFW